MAVTVLKARRLLTGEKDGVLSNGVVVIDGEQIVDVGTQDDVDVPVEADVKDFGDSTILPGLIDCHTHWMLDGSNDPRGTVARETPVLSALRIASHAGETLRCGVTTVRDLGCPHGISIAMREVIAAGLLPGPRVIAAGALITITGGHGSYTARQADGPDDVRRAVREQIRDGADLIKLVASGGVYMNREELTSVQFTIEELSAAVSEARMAEVKVAIHAEGPGSISNAIEVGADTLEHGQYIDAELARRMAEEGVTLVPTIEIFHNIAVNGEKLGAPAYAVEKAKEIVPVHKAGFQYALEAGVQIATGTDVGGPLMLHHEFPMQREIAIMVDYGMGPLDAIRSSTSLAASTIGAHDTGMLQAGKLADVLVCAGNPLDDIGALTQLRAIYGRGTARVPAEIGAIRNTSVIGQLGR